MKVMPERVTISRRSPTLILAAELAKIEPGQTESNLALVYRALIRKAIRGDIEACKMILHGLGECAELVAENNSKTDFLKSLTPRDWKL